jgi:hypothetical protein
MDKKTKLMIGIGIGVIGLAIIGAVILSKKQATAVKKDVSQLTQSEDDQEAIPTAGPGVKVELVPVVSKKEIKLVVSGVPDKTTSIEYEFTYSTKEQESEGVFSTAKPEKGSEYFPKTFERQITLGTCSKNVCRYHNVTSDISVILKFEGGYGAQILQKKFDYAKL